MPGTSTGVRGEIHRRMIDTSGSVGVRGRGMSEEDLLPSLTPEHTPTNMPQQGAVWLPQEPHRWHRSTRNLPPITGWEG